MRGLRRVERSLTLVDRIDRADQNDPNEGIETSLAFPSYPPSRNLKIENEFIAVTRRWLV
jgi:hypothetical protein